MILILDTSALYHKPLLRNLARAHVTGDQEAPIVEAILPSLAYAERLRQIRRDNKDERQWKQAITAAGIRVEPFTVQEADRLDPAAHRDRSWRNQARDHLLLCHIHGRRTAVTDDTGPPWKGRPTITPRAAASGLEEILRENAHAGQGIE